MDKKKSSIRNRIVVSMIVFIAITAVCGAFAIIAVLYLNGHIQDIVAQNGQITQTILADIQQKTFLYCIVFAALIVAAAVFMVYCLYSTSVHIQRPLNVLNNAVSHVARTGGIEIPKNMAADMKRYSNTDNELSSFIISFNLMVESLLEKVAVLEEVAQGDLRNRVKPSSDEDYLGIAVNKVVTNLNSIVNDVITATDQLSVGASELSMGAQSLSQSSSQQSATMDKLHITAGEIAAEAAENAERAADASVLTAQIRTNANEGGRKMMDMTEAMNEINKASHAIESVMKVIDEIAFQTNILALNAAVEAARAGVHGKGFAVVADEVRNLATKSGDAANDSNALIADTISKSDMGTKIVKEAIAFFETIEDGIANINDLLDEIAKATKSQSQAIEQVNRSLTDMANVVYHNSATSEQSAAASQQMNSQAILLKEAVNKFLLGSEIPSPYDAGEIDIVSPPQESTKFELPVWDTTTAPVESSDYIPTEFYVEASERETQENVLPPLPPVARPTNTESETGFTDDESKY